MRHQGGLPPAIEKLVYGLATALAVYLAFVLAWFGLRYLSSAPLWSRPGKGGGSRPEVAESHGLRSTGTQDAVSSVPPIAIMRGGTLRQRRRQD